MKIYKTILSVSKNYAICPQKNKKVTTHVFNLTCRQEKQYDACKTK